MYTGNKVDEDKPYVAIVKSVGICIAVQPGTESQHYSFLKDALSRIVQIHVIKTCEFYLFVPVLRISAATKSFMLTLFLQHF